MANLTMNVKTSTKGFEAFIFACKHTMSDLPMFYFASNRIYFTEQYIVRKTSILQNNILLQYCLNLQNNHLAYTNTKENTKLKFISKKRRGLRLGLVRKTGWR